MLKSNSENIVPFNSYIKKTVKFAGPNGQTDVKTTQQVVETINLHTNYSLIKLH